MSEQQTQPRTAIGKVIGTKMDKTVVVMVEIKEKHPKFGKYITKSSKRYVHDESNSCLKGDVVKIQSTRPLSKQKSWVLVEVLLRKNETA